MTTTRDAVGRASGNSRTARPPAACSVLLAAVLSGLFLAASSFAAPRLATPPEWRYTLRPGDTLIGISGRYLAQPQHWPRLQKLNHIANPYRLQPGAPLRIPVAWLRRQPAPAEVLAVSGEVRHNAVPVRAGASLPAGSRLTTGPDSSVSVRFADGSVMLVEPNSQLQLDSVSVYAGGGMADTRLRLQQGRVETRARPQRGGRLEIHTPSAVAAVRGTHYRVAADAQSTREETLQGTVRLAAARRQVNVGAGQGSVTQHGKPPGVPVKLMAAPLLDGLPSRIETLPLVFGWAADPGVVAWSARVTSGGDPSLFVAERRSTTPKLSVADLPDGHYALHVRARDASGLLGHDATHRFELDARPFPPALLTPGKLVREARPTYVWSGVVEADAYVFEYATDADFSASTRIETTATEATADADLAPDTLYWWRVATRQGSETGPFSPARSLSYTPLPGPPDLSGAFVIDSDTMRLTLPPPAAGLAYDAVLSQDASREQPVWQGISADGGLSMPRPDSGTWVLSVRSREADGVAGPWAARTLEVPVSGWPLLLLVPLFAL